MQEHRCSCCDQEAGLHGQNPSTTILRQIAHRIRQMTHILAFGLLLLILVMALPTAVLLGGWIQVPYNQAMPAGKALLVSETQQQREHPSAFLTAPKNSTNNGEYLQWETKSGIAHLQGLAYSGGNLTVLTEGYYSIALQITLINTKSKCNEDPIQSSVEKQLQITVFRFTVEYPLFKPLLITYDTMCCSKGCKKSLFTSGEFFLNASTILRVKAVHAAHIKQRPDEHEVFFGVHLQS